MTALPPVVDLCAATGLFARAFQDVGFDVVQGFELDPDRAKAWTRNLGARCQVADVLQLRAGDLEAYADARGLVVIGGIPCQDFSTLNNNRQMDTTLRDHALQLVRDVGARAVLENVREGWRGVSDVGAVRDCDVGGFTMRERYFYGCPPVRPPYAMGRAIAAALRAELEGKAPAVVAPVACASGRP